MEELCEDFTLKNLVVMIHQWAEITRREEAELQSDLSSPYGPVQAVVQRGARIYRCTGTSKPDMGALRIILEGKKLWGRVKEAMDKKVEGLRQELEEQKRRAQKEADMFKERIAKMQSERESIRKEIFQELEEEKRRAREEADGLRKCIAELQFKPEENRHGSGKSSATYNFRRVPREYSSWDHLLT